MTHTVPDYTSQYKLINTYGQMDLTEISARLGGYSLFDRRGKVFFLDGFEYSTLTNWTIMAAAGGAMAMDNTKSFYGQSSAKITTAAGSPWTIAILKYLDVPSQSAVGSEIMFMPNHANEIFTLALFLTNGTNEYSAQIRANFATNVMQYMDAAGSWQTLPGTLYWSISCEWWKYFKLVANVSTKKYVRAFIGNMTWDLSAISMHTVGGSSNAYIEVAASLAATDSTQHYGWVDNLVLTHDEP